MKKKINGFIAGTLCVPLLSVSVAYAAGWSENINVVKNSATISVNEQLVNADNFIYNDTTYVPLRAVSESLGCFVDWNNETRTVSIANTPLRLAQSAALALRTLSLASVINESISALNDSCRKSLTSSLDGFLDDVDLSQLDKDLQEAKESVRTLRNAYNQDNTFLKLYVENNLLIGVNSNTMTIVLNNMDEQLSEISDTLKALRDFNSYSEKEKRSEFISGSGNVNTVDKNTTSVRNIYYNAITTIQTVRNALFDYILNLK